MIYRKKADYKVAVARTKSGEAIQVNQMVAPSHLNPHIRGLRLAFVLLFCFMDIGYALYLVSKKKRKRELITTDDTKYIFMFMSIVIYKFLYFSIS